MWRPACRIIHTGVRSTSSPRHARTSSGSFSSEEPAASSAAIESRLARCVTTAVRCATPMESAPLAIGVGAYAQASMLATSIVAVGCAAV